MRTSITAIAMLIAQVMAVGQQTSTFTVKAGESIADVLGQEAIFRFPAFLQGNVIYSDGTYTETLMNYNKVLGEMQFINGKGDTVIIANPEAISQIDFPEDTFYVSDGYLEQIIGDENVMLVVRNYVKLMDVKNQGAYGMSSTANVDNYTSVSAGSNTSTYQLKSNQDMVYSMETDYFFGNEASDFFQARRNALLKNFPEYKSEIKDYIKKESINFNRSPDLVRLTEYVSDLAK